MKPARLRADPEGRPAAPREAGLTERYELVARGKREWEAAVDAVADLVFLVDHSERVLRCNMAACEALELPFVEILERPLNELLATILNPEELPLSSQAGELDLPQGDRVFEYSRFPAYSEGEVLGSVLILRDITELRRLQQVASRVDMMNNMGQVLSCFRHEIGNPTNAMKAALTVMDESLETFSTEKLRSYIQRCLNDTLRIQELLEKLRTFSLFDVSATERMDLRRFLEVELPAIREGLEKQEIRLECELPNAGEAVAVRCDHRALYQIVVGLIVNAREAIEETKRPGRIRLALSQSNGEVLLAICDDGPGIPAEHLSKVILPLFTTKGHGTGLGLAIAHEMLTRMGGSLEVGNDPDLGGARAVIHLQAAAGEGPPAAPAETR